MEGPCVPGVFSMSFNKAERFVFKSDFGSLILRLPWILFALIYTLAKPQGGNAADLAYAFLSLV